MSRRFPTRSALVLSTTLPTKANQTVRQSAQNRIPWQGVSTVRVVSTFVHTGPCREAMTGSDHDIKPRRESAQWKRG